MVRNETFQKFNTRTEAEYLAEQLTEMGIEAEIENTSPPVDITFSGNRALDEFCVKIPPHAFEEAHRLLEEEVKRYLDHIPPDYYLYEFSDTELIDILTKYDEWSKEDYLLAQRILAERGLTIDEEQLQQLKYQRNEAQKQPIKATKELLFFGFACAVLGGFFGLIIGWIYWSSTKVTLEGKRVYVYDSETRKSGKTIFLIGGISLTLSILWVAWQRGFL